VSISTGFLQPNNNQNAGMNTIVGYGTKPVEKLGKKWQKPQIHRNPELFKILKMMLSMF
jgi:hypothetical protein